MSTPAAPPAPKVVKAPTTELGHASQSSAGWWSYDPSGEQTPELRWPLNVRVYDAMRRQDAQVASVLRAVTLPVRRTQWRVDGSGCRPDVAQHVADDLGLALVGSDGAARPLRTRDRFSWSHHLSQALLSLPFGHAYFEQVYRLDDAGLARLRKLALRPSRSLAAVNVADDGGLVSIEQVSAGIGTAGTANVTIPVARLVAYVSDREGGDWLGTSLLRAAYKHWLIKDRLLRVWAQTVERNGMGVPLYKGAEGGTPDDLNAGAALAQAWRAGESAGAAVPFGADLVLRGVQGTLPDADAAIRYQDEQIARAVLAHFLNLGTQTGSWALGSTFADFFTLSLQTVAESIRDTTQQHVIEDLVDVNYGAFEPAPRLVFDEIGSQRSATAEAIKALIDAGAVFPDRQLEEFLRNAYGLPAKGAFTPTPTTTGA